MAAFGAEAFLRFARQESFSVAVTASGSFHAVPFINESLVLGIPDVISDTIRGRYEEGPSVQGYQVAGGDVTFRPHPDSLGVFLYAAMGVCSTTNMSSLVGQHIFTPTNVRYVDNCALQPWTIEKYAGAGDSHQMTDAVCNRFMLEIAPGQYLRGASNWMCRAHSTMAQGSVSYPSGLEFTWNQASISIAGAANVFWEQVTLTMDNALQFVPALDGTKIFRRILRNGFRTFQLTGTADFPDNSEFMKFKVGCEQVVDITVSGISITGSQNELLRIEMPNFRYVTYPIAVTGPNRVTVGFTGKAIYNQGSGFAARFTLQNTRYAGY